MSWLQKIGFQIIMETNETRLCTQHVSAVSKLGEGLAYYVEKSAGEGRTYRSNMHEFAGYRVVGDRNSQYLGTSNTDTYILGRRITTPIMIAPTAWHGMFTLKGEAATSAAAKTVGTNYVISSFSTLDFPQIDSTLSHAWYQILMYKDLNLMKRYIDKAVDAGCSAIVITVDAVIGCSMCKQDPTVPQIKFPVHKLPIFPEDPLVPYSTLDDYYEKYMPMRLNWDDVREIVSYTKIPIILKGILTADGVQNAINVGAKAVIISNHGGRQSDTLPASLKALTMLPSDFRNKIEIYLDSGIRSGADVFKAIALGAKAVLVGRPVIYGLTIWGEKGVVETLNLLTRDLQKCMQLAQCPTLANITSDKVEWMD